MMRSVGNDGTRADTDSNLDTRQYSDLLSRALRRRLILNMNGAVRNLQEPDSGALQSEELSRGREAAALQSFNLCRAQFGSQFADSPRLDVDPETCLC